MKSAFDFDRSHAAFISLHRPPCQAVCGLCQDRVGDFGLRAGSVACALASGGGLADRNAGSGKAAAHLGDLGGNLL